MVDLTKLTLQETDEIIKLTGGRLAGTPSCKKSAEKLYDMMEFCDSRTIEPFIVRPEAFIGFMKVIAVFYSLALLSLFIPSIGIFLSVGIMTFATALSLSQFVFYKSYFDKFFSKKVGYNVYGNIEPKNEVKQQVIFAGHHDSARIFTYLDTKWQKYYSHRILLGLIPAIYVVIFEWVWLISSWTGAIPSWIALLYDALPWIMLIFAVFPINLYFFTSNKIAPGAGDNLVSSVLSINIGKYFKQNQKLLQNTRIIVASFDGEESGLRGAKHYAQKFQTQLHEIPTYVFNIDSIYDPEQIQFLTRDINGFKKLSKNLATECQSIAKDLGYQTRLFPFTFGGGGTDAAEFARIGVDATSLIALPTEWVRSGLVYHTQHDVVENIDPKVVEATLDIAIHFALDKDHKLSIC